MDRFKVNMLVFDRWWPWRTGKVVRVGKTRIRVQWLNNEQCWSYDHAHEQFLEQLNFSRKGT